MVKAKPRRFAQCTACVIAYETGTEYTIHYGNDRQPTHYCGPCFRQRNMHCDYCYDQLKVKRQDRHMLGIRRKVPADAFYGEHIQTKYACLPCAADYLYGAIYHTTGVVNE